MSECGESAGLVQALVQAFAGVLVTPCGCVTSVGCPHVANVIVVGSSPITRFHQEPGAIRCRALPLGVNSGKGKELRTGYISGG